MAQGCVEGCQHLPPVSSLEELFKYAQIQCKWTEVYARELGWNIKKSINKSKRISLACSPSSKNCVSVPDIRDYFGIEEGRFKIKCNKTVNGITLIRSSFPGEYCPNFEECHCFILRQLDQEKFRNLWWLERLICNNTSTYLDTVRAELLQSKLSKELNPFCTQNLPDSSLLHSLPSIEEHGPEETHTSQNPSNTQRAQINSTLPTVSIQPRPISDLLPHSRILPEDQQCIQTGPLCLYSRNVTTQIDIPTFLILDTSIPGLTREHPTENLTSISKSIHKKHRK